MAIESPLGSLCKVLKQLRDSASRHEEVLKKSEAMTRATLIDPLLRALGWDIADANMVELERYKGGYRADKGGCRADYVLLAPDAETKVIVEVKKWELFHRSTTILSLKFLPTLATIIAAAYL